MSLNFSGMNIGGSNSGGIDTSNHLESGTIITVETDGSGDYTTLYDAIQFVNTQWSEGTVTIQLGEGTFNESNKTSSYLNNSIAYLNILGKGKDKTILSYSQRPDSEFGIKIQSPTLLSDLKVYFPNGTSGNDCRGISVVNMTNATLQYIEVENANIAIYSGAGASAYLCYEIDVINAFSNAIYAAATARIFTRWQTQINITNATNGFMVTNGGIIAANNPIVTYSGVTNKTNQAVGTATDSGWIVGITV